MKTSMSLLLVCLLFVATSGFADNRNIKGNGKAVTKEIPIKEYDAISLLGSVDFEYQQSAAAPYLKIEVDDNILPFVSIKVEGRTLKVYPKSVDGGEDGHGPNYNFHATVFKITSNSRELKEVELTGSADLTVISSLSAGNRIEVNIAGSGSVNFEKALTGMKAEFSVAGSGEINARQIGVEKLNCSVAGSGEIYLKGDVPRASYSVAGSGEIKGFDCKVKTLECSVAGSGEIEAYVTEKLDASVVSSGDITYKGNPATLNKSTLGSGSIQKAD